MENLDTQEVLERISRHCPEALSAYLQCYNRADSEGYVSLSYEQITEMMSESYCRFKNNLKKLALENLLEWHEVEKNITVRLANVYD